MITPKISVDALVTVFIRCSNCGKQIDERDHLSEESLRTGNTTQQASYAVDAMKARVTARASTRGWTHVENADREQVLICGACNDRDRCE